MKKQRLSRREVLKGSTAFALGTVFASPARAEAPPAEAITPQLIEAAKKDGKVVLYSAMDLPVGEKLGKAFEAKYPGIQVQIERSGSERLFQRIDQEFSSGIRAADNRPKHAGCDPPARYPALDAGASLAAERDQGRCDAPGLSRRGARLHGRSGRRHQFARHHAD